MPTNFLRLLNAAKATDAALTKAKANFAKATLAKVLAMADMTEAQAAFDRAEQAFDTREG